MMKTNFTKLNNGLTSTNTFFGTKISKKGLFDIDDKTGAITINPDSGGYIHIRMLGKQAVVDIKNVRKIKTREIMEVSKISDFLEKLDIADIVDSILGDNAALKKLMNGLH